ncbi:unnamed protein product, partial [Sphacelaria rigidula]
MVIMHKRSPKMEADTIEVEAAGQGYKQVESLLYLGGKISSIGDVTPEIHSRIGQAWMCISKYSTAVYDNPYITLATKVRLLKAEVIEVMLYGCVTWKIAHDNFSALWEARRGRSVPDYHMLPNHEVLERTSCERIEATVMNPTLLHAGRVERMHDERLPNIVMRGVMIGRKTRAGLTARCLQYCITDYCSYFGIDSTSWAQIAQDVSECSQVVEEG